MSSLDHFDAQEIIGSPGEDFEYPLSLENHSSFSAFDSPGITEFNASFKCSSMEASERPINAFKAEGVSGAVPNASSASFISFGNVESAHDPLQPWPRTESFYSHDSTSNETTLDFQRPERNGMVSRPTSQDHVIAERKRREKLSQQFIALSAIIPGLKKTDKASLLGDAVDYLKQLEEKAKTLEEQAVKKSAAEPIIFVKKSLHISNTNGSSPGEAVQKIEASLEGKAVLMSIHCEKKKGVLVKVLSEIEKLHLGVINMGVVPFIDSSLNITVTAQASGCCPQNTMDYWIISINWHGTKIEEGFSMTEKDLVKELNSALSQWL
ncbi:transcription factor bHLH18-like [Phoenix dactylifera]|uniref:Transcription factor bHLH18-like n=1 Tax=Phoenix dactylifera TaxID=42345 RepID=A0A8B8J2M8_PHODC|nr:transcription factor bHLH18-like [Phoenix dactylifera]